MGGGFNDPRFDKLAGLIGIIDQFELIIDLRRVGGAPAELFPFDYCLDRPADQRLVLFPGDPSL